ncbi:MULTISPECIES: hypothetical protein [unclassified Sphingomonas]|uniref:hypothetical protein n=1 Tax=unclassified Sphingomonas TaxID=196159 RepID=UPI00285E91A5|nr:MULTISPECIES: hypothetical protein [unclassified Sphingomonas]MDR6113317.1 hypothetical protein [Sphingomonas sp. SORGH_AS_0789]MDR6149322.1 hypothetical protein [Sphingomonas sp. SORGH_AS_0742]
MITPIIREYFKGLKEQDELDVVIPDLLTSMGFEVVRRPKSGNRQYGADVIAVGNDTDGERKLFVFSIKRGDLTRQEWAGGEQALRQSLDEIKDVILNNRAPEHEGLKVVICITLGGIVPEAIEPLVNGYMRSNRTRTLDYQVWTGDTLTRKILDGALREELFSGNLRTLLRKAAVTADDPERSIAHFERLVDAVAGGDADPVEKVRILYLALWILFVWGRDASNLEAPYQASEIVTLRAWELLHGRIERDRGRRLDASHSFHQVVTLHLRIWDELYWTKVLPHAGKLHVLSFAVGSVDGLDINLSMFETIGRVAIGGLWRLWMEPGQGAVPKTSDLARWPARSIAEALGRMPVANPTLFSPVADHHSSDLALALLLLCSVRETRDAARRWVRGLAQRVIFAYRHHGRYPANDGSYSFLLRHPEAATDEYRQATMAASVTLPLLAMVAYLLDDAETVASIDEFQKTDVPDCSFQAWVPNSRTDGKIWTGDPWQGSSVTGLKVGDGGSELVAALQAESDANPDYPMLSAIRLEHWPILLLACRRLRLPVPPQLWMTLMNEMRLADHDAAASKSDPRGERDAAPD